MAIFFKAASNLVRNDIITRSINEMFETVFNRYRVHITIKNGENNKKLFLIFNLFVII